MNDLLLKIAEHEIGTKEIPGVKNNPRILHYAARSGLNWVKNDETSWCGIFMGFCIAEIPECMRNFDYPTTKAATARQWLNAGIPVPEGKKRPGDIVVFWRESKSSWKGHVAIYIREDENNIYCLGGNQRNSVSIQPYTKKRLLGIRRL